MERSKRLLSPISAIAETTGFISAFGLIVVTIYDYIQSMSTNYVYSVANNHYHEFWPELILLIVSMPCLSYSLGRRIWSWFDD